MQSPLAQQAFVESAKPLVPIDRIRPSQLNPPSKLRYEDLAGLQGTLTSFGVLQEPLLRRQGEFYEIVLGHRRIEAAKRAGVKAVHARVMELSDADALILSIIENEQRQDWSPLEKAKAYAKLRELTGWSLRRIAKFVGKDVSQVSRHIDILELSNPVKELLTRDKTFTEGHLRWIGKLQQHDQIEAAKQVAQENLTCRQTESLVRRRMATYVRGSSSGHRTPSRRCLVNDLEPRKWKEYADRCSLQYYSVWPVVRHDPFFAVPGTIYPGTFPMVVAVNCVLRFSKAGDVVVDPFIGSGTTLVACAMHGRRGIGVDVNPEAQAATEKRFSIVSERQPRMKKALAAQRFIQGDSRDLSFLRNESVDLVIAHPPYLDMKDYGPKGTYHHPSEYREFLRATFNEVHRVLKPQRYFCIQIAPYAARHAALHYMTYQIADQVGFRFVDEVIILFEDYVGYSSSASGRVSTARRKVSFGKYRSIATNSFLHNHEYVVFFQKQK
jgi:ParB family chromosome partitioning protein